ncbi:putative ABC transport system permease protein [Bryocella elongata]|uniref:Putative ABC transport system permease protein n=1 Tax=Bryocella elongata TaxID=863522 RepID=A0A1H5YAV0_9BACT|nr:ABC transporter permease [Bryocella elongata]SEG20885.1 putative ABC transport system permease protein [Bryocella elongata]
METKEAFRIAVQSLWANKLRSVLTLLGVVIGVASVIAVVTLINGANSYVATKINKQGADVFTISQQPAFTTSYKEYLKFQKRKVIGLDQYHAIQQGCTLCKEVGALQSTTGKIVYGTQSSTDTQIRGYTAYMPEMQNLDIAEGRSLTQSDEEHATRVCIVGSDIEENLLKFADPIGKEIRVDGVPCTIVGLGEKQGKTLGQSQDNWVAIPLTAYQKTYGTKKSVTIYAKAGSGAAAMQAASDQGRVIMRQIRHDRPGEDDSFTLETSSALAGLFSTISNYIGGVAVAIAAISLVVGGVVIMNIMLVSVTERTREIGVRKALGARRNDVLLQFLMESGTLSLIGGIFGVIGGVVVAKAVSILLGFPAEIALWSVFVGLFVALSTGVFFGVYPARKAAELDPIVALRSDF